MYCSKCGKQNLETNSYCAGCGNNLKESIVPNNTNVQVNNVAPQVDNTNYVAPQVEVPNNPVFNEMPVNNTSLNVENQITNEVVVNTPSDNMYTTPQVENTSVQVNPAFPNQPEIVVEPTMVQVETLPEVNAPVVNSANLMPEVQPNTYPGVVNQTPVVNNQNLGTVDLSVFNNNVTTTVNNPAPKQPKKKSKKGKIILAIILIFIGFYFISDYGLKNGWFGGDTKLDDIKGNELTETSGTRTIMVYMIGSDLESQYDSASNDIEEMIESNFNSKDVNVIIYTAGAKKWKISDIDAKKNSIFKVTSNGLEKVTTFNQKSAAKKESLTEFIDYVYDNYKADLYDLILWNHGGGPNVGYGKDEVFNQLMTMADINNALDASKLVKETKFEIIGFDACLMGSAEVANILKEEANYLVASEEVEPGMGWDYSFLSKINKNTSSIDMGKKIIDYFYNYYDDLYNYATTYGGYKIDPFEITLALIDLGNIDKLITAIDNSFEDVSVNLNTSTYTSISKNTQKAAQYGRIDDSNSYDLVDLYDLASKNTSQLKNSTELMSAIKEVVIYEKNTLKGSNGISIYFPIVSKNKLSSYLNNYSSFNFSTNYVNFLKKYNGYVSGKKLVTSSTKNVIPTIESNKVSVQLPDDLANNYLYSDYMIFKENDFGGHWIVYKGNNIEVKGNTLTTTPINKELVITDKNGEEPNFVTSFVYDYDDNSITYKILLQLENVKLGDFRIDNVYFVVKFENGAKEGKVIDIIPANKTDDVSNRITIDLNNYTHIASMSYSYTLEDANGEMLETPTTGDTIYGAEYNLLEDGYKFILSDFDDKDYYYVFRIEDTQGNMHYLPKVKLNK